MPLLLTTKKETAPLTKQKSNENYKKKNPLKKCKYKKTKKSLAPLKCKRRKIQPKFLSNIKYCTLEKARELSEEK
jgi:hypothetical protein